MKIIKFLIFWTLTIIVIYISNLFFEYIINRSYKPDCTMLNVSSFGIICSIVMFAIWIMYGIYLANTLFKLLKI